jgi:methyl-accepting chemotaxis protein
VLGVGPDAVVGANPDRVFGVSEINQTSLSALHAPVSKTVHLRDRWLELAAAPVFSQDRRLLGAVVAWTDVTGRHSTSEHVAQSLGQMTAAISQISSNAQEATQTAHEAATTAAEISERFARLRESSAAVGDVVGVIDRVASQTQLLALNATIEAARVGEAGRGFAVVAGEVKDLARETANSTGDIRTRVQAIQAGTEEATTAVNRIVEIMSEISDRQTTIAAAVEEQTSTSTELRRILTEVLGS